VLERVVFDVQLNCGSMSSSGASRDYINLLPDPADGAAWTMYMPTVEDIGDDPIFAFDGQTTAVEVPRGVVDPDKLGTSFTVSTWMKHDRQENDGKQQILCAADGEGIQLVRVYRKTANMCLSASGAFIYFEPYKGAITSKIKHSIKLKTSPARLAQLLQPSLAFCFSSQPMTAYRPGLDGMLQQLCKSCRTSPVLCFIACFILLVIAA